MKNILIIAGRYLPGYKDGGPVRTIKNLIDSLGDKYHFTVMCADRDHGDEKPYDGIKINEINHAGKADIYYSGEGKFSFSEIKKLINDSDFAYVCGIYNNYAIRSMVLYKFGMIKCPFVIAPMGSFSKGALAIKSTKKQLFLKAMKLLGLFKDVAFSVTSEVEMEELREALNISNKCYIAKDPQRKPLQVMEEREYKQGDKLNIVFLSRINEKKNLLGTISILSKVKIEAVFHIYGNKEDEEYFDKCMDALHKLPENIVWEYKGEADSEKVPEIMSKYDVFLFPTHGENFGHVISEALMAGTIPIISDTTPWLDFDNKACGRVIAHGDEDRFCESIDEFAHMSRNDIKSMSQNAMNYYLEKYEEEKIANGYVQMFDELMGD